MEYEHLSCARSRSGRRVRSLWNVALSHTWLSFADPLFGLVPFCSAVLACAVQRRESAVIIHTAPLCGAPSPPRIRPLGSSEGQALCHAAARHQLSILHMTVCTCQCYFLHSSLCPSPAASTCPSSTSVFPALQIGPSVPLFWSPHMWVNTQYLFFFLTSLCRQGSWVHPPH